MYSAIKNFISNNVKTYTNAIDEQEEKHTDDKLEKIFIDTQTIPEKHNSRYVADVLSIPNIDKIIDKTYEVDDGLDDNSKKCHDLLKKHKLYKITNSKESHHFYFYKTGKNTFQGEFSHDAVCGYGGLFFAKEGDILNWLSWGIFIREVFLLPDSKIVNMGTKFKTDKFILGSRSVITCEFIKEQQKILGNDLFETNEKSNITKITNLLASATEPSFDAVRACNNPILWSLMANDSSTKWKDSIYMNLLGANCNILRVFGNMQNPSYAVQKRAVELCPQCIEKIPNPDPELCKIAINNYDAFLHNITNEVTKNEILEYLDTNNMFYSLQYFRTIGEHHQKYLIEKCKLFIMLIAYPTPDTIAVCSEDPTTKCYTDMYTKSIESYKCNDTDDVIKTRLFDSLKPYFFDDVSTFMSMLIKYGGYISGSFACNTLYNTNHKFSDIDIYFNSFASAMNFGEELKRFEYLRTSCVTYNSYSILGTHIDKIITHKVLGPRYDIMPKIQLIVITADLNFNWTLPVCVYL